MSDAMKIALTSGLTILGGVVVFTLGQLIERFYIDPVHKLFLLIGEIADSLTFYAQYYSSPGLLDRAGMDEAQRVLRQHASQLRARSHAVRALGLWNEIGLLPSRTALTNASTNLIGLSNSIHDGDPHRNDETVAAIEQALDIEIPR